ncbi:hypothetical protein ERK19_05020 [Lactobacillus helsingborgensis]|uniref:hypothetical protein n=1 Tax=Lactobacillus helsingborgensis TaxID=1218494 RepID=UPI0016500BED|nr:hypothetical protein [Lactobacillus helsingborgensis]MBC6356711.1 hypothetical protein [Lactobacillus helsingborgensis]
MQKLDILKKITQLSDPQKEILNIIKHKCDIQANILYACVYSSKFDGLGNKFSDLDVYAIVNDSNVYLKHFNFVLGKTPLDIEVISNGKINKLIQKNKYDLTDGDLKRLWRLKISFPIYKSLTNVEEILKFDVVKVIFDLSHEKAYELRDDGNKMFKVKNFISAVECFRSSIVSSIKAYGCLCGHVIVKDKWLLYSFVENKGYGNEGLLKRVENLLIFPTVSKENLQKYTSNLASLASDLLFTNELNSN